MRRFTAARITLAILLLASSAHCQTPPTPPTPAELKKRYVERTAALHEAAEKGQVSLVLDLLKSGADVNDKDAQGRTPLFKAAEKGNRSAAITLLMFGADVGEKDSKGMNPIHVAAATGHAEVLKLLVTPYLLQQAAGDVIKGGAGEALKAAGLNLKGASDRLSALLDSSNSAVDAEGQTPFMKAAANGHSDCAWALGVNNELNRKDRQGHTALMLAASGGHTELIRRMWPDVRISPTYILLTDNDGKTASQLAEAANKTVTAKLLADMEKKAKEEIHRLALVALAKANDVAGLKEQLSKSETPTSVATDMMLAACAEGNTQVVRLLMDMWKEKPVDEKTRLVGFPLVYFTRPESAFHVTAMFGHLETLRAITDPDWWKDKVTLADLLGRKDQGQAVYRTATELASKPAISELLQKRMRELEAKK